MGALRLGAVVVLALAACIDDPNVICGAIACPQGSVCTSLGCASPAQLTACVGLQTNDACMTAGISNGACIGSDNVCEPVVCGDGLVMGTEVCDDGNQQAGDGCSADCRSDETCGNGIVDGAVGEQCDDGAPIGLSHDGCSSTCQIEVETWQQRYPSVPSARARFRTAYDDMRNRLVLFGGHDNTGYLGDTWLLAGTTWGHVTPAPVSMQAPAPSPRGDYAMAWDPPSGRVFLYGGTDGVSKFTDTWAWDGSTWQPLQPSNSVAPNAVPLMVFDNQRTKMVLVLGANLLVWNGTDWALEYTSIAGSGTQREIAYDSAHSTLVVYAYTATMPPSAATYAYTYSGTTWSGGLLAATNTPLLSNATLVGVAGAGALLFGTNTNASNQAETWLLDPSVPSWTQLVGDQPPARQNPGLAYDTNNNKVVLFGGSTQSMYFGDVWRLNGSDWGQVTTSGGPPVRHNAPLAFSRERRATLMYGGSPGTIEGAPDRETWAWDGRDWQLLGTPKDAGIRFGHGMVSTKAGVVLVGGGNAGKIFDDTWQWNDRMQWWDQLTAKLPVPTMFVGAAYDLYRDRIVLFGGAQGVNADVACAVNTTGFGTVADTLELVGGTWTTVATGTAAPPARARPGLAYDAIRRQTIMFGGCNESAKPLGDTWAWDGTAWTQLMQSSPTPSARHSVAMSYDPTRGDVRHVRGSGALAITEHTLA